jgi:hypothetical protein
MSWKLKSSSSEVSSTFSFPFPGTVARVSLATPAASSAGSFRSILSISASVVSRFDSSVASVSVVSASVLASVATASAAAVLSMAGVFDAEVGGGVCSITSTT